MSRQIQETVERTAWQYLQTSTMEVREQSILRPLPSCYLDSGVDSSAADSNKECTWRSGCGDGWQRGEKRADLEMPRQGQLWLHFSEYVHQADGLKPRGLVHRMDD